MKSVADEVILENDRHRENLVCRTHYSVAIHGIECQIDLRWNANIVKLEENNPTTEVTPRCDLEYSESTCVIYGR